RDPVEPAVDRIVRDLRRRAACVDHGEPGARRERRAHLGAIGRAHSVEHAGHDGEHRPFVGGLCRSRLAGSDEQAEEDDVSFSHDSQLTSSGPYRIPAGRHTLSPMKVARALFLIALLGTAGWFYKSRYLDLFEAEGGAALAGTASTLPVPPKAKAVRILFIGNSLTHTENMPGMLVGLARAGGVNLEVTQHTPGGSTLAQHSTNPAVISLLEAGGWDYVVIQEQSERPAFREEQVRKDSDPGVATLARSARAGSPGVKL